MPFENGHPKMGGRQKGVPNLATQEARDLASSIIEDPKYLCCLRKRILAGQAPQLEVMLWHYAYGRPQPNDDPEQSLMKALRRIRPTRLV